jgi:hypothetical protein
MDKIANIGLLLFLVCCVVGAAGVLGGSGVIDVWRAQAEAREAEAHALEYDARARLVVAEGDAAILQEAARAVASDRQLATFYALSLGIFFLVSVLSVGVMIGVFIARSNRREKGQGLDWYG